MQKLWKSQQEALDVLVPAGRAIYGDAAGSGKTRTSLAALEAWGAERTLVLVPDQDLIHPQWMAEAGRDGFVTINGSGTAPQRGRARELLRQSSGPAVLVVNYHSAWRDADALKDLGFQAVIADEAHHLKDRQSATFKGIRLITRRVPRVILVTGTPVLNSADEAWSYLHLINARKWSSYHRWTQEHFYVEVTDFWGTLPRPVRLVGDIKPGHEEILRAELGDFLVQRSFDELFPDAPPVIEHEHIVQLSPEERKLYDEIVRRKWTRMGDTTIVAPNKVAQITRLRQFASEWRTLANGMVTPGAKVLKTTEIVNGTREQIVAVVGYKETGRQIAGLAEGATVILDGDVKRSHRRQYVDEFIEGERRVLVGTTPVVGEGVDGLQVAHNLVLHDRDWTPARDEQVVARLRRGGQISAVHVHYPLAEGTIDEMISETRAAKAKVVASITGASDAVR